MTIEYKALREDLCARMTGAERSRLRTLDLSIRKLIPSRSRTKDS
jgi:hypothetical protein